MTVTLEELLNFHSSTRYLLHLCGADKRANTEYAVSEFLASPQTAAEFVVLRQFCTMGFCGLQRQE